MLMDGRAEQHDRRAPKTIQALTDDREKNEGIIAEAKNGAVE